MEKYDPLKQITNIKTGKDSAIGEITVKTKTMTKDEQISDIADEIQKECHATVQSVLKNTRWESDKRSPEYQDVTNVFLMRKLAELQLEINELKKK